MSTTADILRVFADKLAEAGLLVPSVEADGAMHRCGTKEKPHSKNGAYTVHLDPPATLWWQNWQTGETDTACVGKGSRLTATEREAFKARIAAAKEETERERAEAHAKAARAAQAIWNAATPIPENHSHAYLVRKGVLAYGLRVSRKGELLMPLMDETGAMQSLQRIKEDGEKKFLYGGKTSGVFYAIPAEGGAKDGTLLIAEGYATAATLRMATGYAVLVAVNAGNLDKVAGIARALYPHREIMLAADNDARTAREKPTIGNVGKDKAEQAAGRIKALVALCPSIEGENTDFNDLCQAQGLIAVEDAIKAAVTSGTKRQDYALPEGYFIIHEGKRAGLYKTEERQGEPQELRLGDPLYVRGVTRDSTSNDWGLMLEWYDLDNNLHQWAMPLSLLNKQGAEWYGQLLHGGWRGAPNTRSKLAAFLTQVRPDKRIRCVPRVGWYGEAFVLPDATYSAATTEKVEEVALQASNHAYMYQTSGSLEDWQGLAGLAVGNSRLELALCAAFAAPLLTLAGLESGGFNFVGGSSTGKTTGLRLAASVWDSPTYVRSWRTTDNALEGLASLHNDTVLILDELGQAAGNAVSEASYMLTNGQGKARSSRDGSPRRLHCWRLLFLSSGELGLADKLAEIGQRPRAGQEVRLVDIPADAGAGMGIFECLHAAPNAAALSLRIAELAGVQYGHAGRRFLQWLVTERRRLEKTIRPEMLALAQRFCPDKADGQVFRVSQRFAVCALAGELAKQAGVLPHALDAVGCAERCFKDWLGQRGNMGASEDAAILSAVRLFIEQHGASRFQDMSNPTATCINRVGFRQLTSAGHTEYIVLPESFKAEVVKGYSHKKAGNVLRAAGWLKQSDGKSTTKRELPSLGRVRVYVLVVPEEHDMDGTPALL